MILLRNEREIVAIERWEDILERPGFESRLDPKEHKLADAIGSYTLGSTVPCGLSDCRQQHSKGFLVVTTSGRETNIGHRCGEIYFGEDFKKATARLARDVTEKRNRERVHSFALQTDAYRDRIRVLREQPYGADWVYLTSRYLIEPGKAPAKLVRQLASMVKTGESVIVEQRQATEQEAEDADIRTGGRVRRPYLIDEPVAEIQGLEALRPENDLWELLVIQLGQGIEDFERLNLDALGFNELRHWAKWAGEVDGLLDRAAVATEHGRRLLTAENLEPLGRFVDADDRQRFQKVLRSLARPPVDRSRE